MLLDFGLHQMLNSLDIFEWHLIEATHERNTYEIQLEKSEMKIRHKMILHIAQQKHT
jgi:hypothetical protein